MKMLQVSSLLAVLTFRRLRYDPAMRIFYYWYFRPGKSIWTGSFEDAGYFGVERPSPTLLRALVETGTRTSRCRAGRRRRRPAARCRWPSCCSTVRWVKAAGPMSRRWSLTVKT